MTTKTIVIIIAVLLVLGGGYFFFVNRAAAPTPDQGTGTSAPSETLNPSVQTTTTSTTTTSSSSTIIKYTNTGFSPKSVSVKVGDTVTFVNNSSHGMWVASNVHPTHTEYDGTDTHTHCTNGTDNNGGFDECSPVANGTSYSFTFTKAGTFNFHNHVNASDTGTVVVSQ